jgi:hypothetical protein
MKKLISLVAVLLLAAGCPQTLPAKEGQPPVQQEHII